MTGAGFVARTGVYVLDVEVGALGLLGLQVTHEKHLYGELVYACGHVTRSVPGRGAPEAEWKVELTEWHLVGPMLAALIVCLSHRMLVSRADPGVSPRLARDLSQYQHPQPVHS